MINTDFTNRFTLLTQFGEDGRLKFLPPLNGSGQGNIIGVFQLAAKGKPPSETGNPDTQG